MPVNQLWFQERLADRDLSQRGLARLMGIDAAAVSLMLRGKRKMTLDEAAQIAVLLNVTTNEVLENAGVTVQTGATRVKVTGFLRGDGTVVSQAKGLHEHTEGHQGLPPDCIAVQCRTHGSTAEHLDGWMLFISDSHENPATVIGTTAMVAVKGNGLQIGYVKRGYRRGAYNIAGLCGDLHTDVELAWASPVLWIRTVS